MTSITCYVSLLLPQWIKLVKSARLDCGGPGHSCGRAALFGDDAFKAEANRLCKELVRLGEALGMAHM
jgi:hypothetical protein